MCYTKRRKAKEENREGHVVGVLLERETLRVPAPDTDAPPGRPGRLRLHHGPLRAWPGPWLRRADHHSPDAPSLPAWHPLCSAV